MFIYFSFVGTGVKFLLEHAVTAFKLLTEDNYRIRRIMPSFNNRHGSSQNLLVDFHHSSLNAEHTIQRIDYHHSSSNIDKTIQRYSTSNTLPTSRPLVEKPDGINYRKECF